jgi:hypothetical protein
LLRAGGSWDAGDGFLHRETVVLTRLYILICNERHLRRVLSVYLAHYNTRRPRRGLDLEIPVRVPEDEWADTDGPIERVDVLGGLIHEYRRAA